MKRCPFPNTLVVAMVVAVLLPAQAGAAPSFDCDKVREGSVEKLICDDADLAALDRELAGVFKAAVSKEKLSPQSPLKAEQRGWIKGRDECWKSSDLRACVENNYQRRIAELQARYRLVEVSDTVLYECEKNPANEIVVSFFDTSPKVIVAERGDETFLLFKDGNNEQYQGRNEIMKFSKGDLEASLAFEAPFLNCRAKNLG